MVRKIVADSSANLYTLEGADFASAPLVISTDDKEYRDDEALNVRQMIEELAGYKGRSHTACPGVGDWLAAFGDADEVFCTTISANLSGSYNAAMTAKAHYEEEHPGRKVFVMDSCSTGPEMKLHIDRMRDLIKADADFDTICSELTAYREETSILFCLEHMRNLVNNGRVSGALAAIVGMLGIRIIGNGTGGVLTLTDKVRGEKKALACLFRNMKAAGYQGGKVYIDHCFHESAAEDLRSLILAEFPQAQIIISLNHGLCSYYAEEHGVILGYEIAK